MASHCFNGNNRIRLGFVQLRNRRRQGEKAFRRSLPSGWNVAKLLRQGLPKLSLLKRRLTGLGLLKSDLLRPLKLRLPILGLPNVLLPSSLLMEALLRFLSDLQLSLELLGLPQNFRLEFRLGKLLILSIDFLLDVFDGVGHSLKVCLFHSGVQRFAGQNPSGSAERSFGGRRRR